MNLILSKTWEELGMMCKWSPQEIIEWIMKWADSKAVVFKDEYGEFRMYEADMPNDHLSAKEFNEMFKDSIATFKNTAKNIEEIIADSVVDIKFDEASRNNNQVDSINTKGERMLDVREIDVTTARKDHVCNFSGREIKDGDQYFSIVYTNENGDHRTYRVEYDEFQQFVKEKIFMEPGYDYTAMEGDLDMLVGHVRHFYDKYGDVPGVKDRVKRLRNLIKD